MINSLFAKLGIPNATIFSCGAKRTGKPREKMEFRAPSYITYSIALTAGWPFFIITDFV
jgi:hypothetical protein